MVWVEASANWVKRRPTRVMCRPARRPSPRTTGAADWPPCGRRGAIANSSNCSPMRFPPRPGTIQILIQSTRIGQAGMFERADDKARIGTVQRVLGLANNAPFAAPAAARAIAEVAEHPRRLARRQAQAPGLGTLFAERRLQAGIARQTEHIIDAVLLAPPHQRLVGEATVAAQNDAHPRPRRRICAMMRAISSTAPSLPATFARRCRPAAVPPAEHIERR